MPSGAWVLPCAWGPPWAGVLPALRGFGAASLPPLAGWAPAAPFATIIVCTFSSAIAPPRPLGAALRVGAWPCGAGVSVLKVAPAYSGAEYKPGPGDLCDLVRVSGDVRSLRSL